MSCRQIKGIPALIQHACHTEKKDQLLNVY
jgi:hypothetical protein